MKVIKNSKCDVQSMMRAAMPRRRQGFTLVELIVVISLLVVLLLMIASSLWGAIKIERSDAATLNRITVQAQLADQFREDVGRATACPDSTAAYAASSTCLILQLANGRQVVYQWHDDRLVRREINEGQESAQFLSVGTEELALEFSRLGERLITLRLIERRGIGRSKRDWPVEFSAALGGDLW